MKDKIHISDLTNEFYYVEKHWKGIMPIMAMEEAGEFIQAISKLERFHRENWYEDPDGYETGLPYGSGLFQDRDSELTENVVKEAADLIIAIGALGNTYGYTIDQVEDAIVEKLKKTY